jgi:predicted RNase H-like nuclease (RuvC/YqgF family)
MDRFLAPFAIVIFAMASWMADLATPVFANVNAPDLLVPIIVAVLSGGGITAIVNLFLFRSNKDSIISQAAENAVTAQREAYKDTIEQLRDRIRDLESENDRLRREAADLKARLESHEDQLTMLRRQTASLAERADTQEHRGTSS